MARLTLEIRRRERPLARRGFAAGFGLALGLLLAGCGSDGSGPTAIAGATDVREAGVAGVPVDGDPDLTLVAELPVPASSGGGIEDVVIKGDILQVEIFGVDKLNRTVQVDTSGRITLALIGDVQAAGKSVRALQKEISDRYGKSYLNSPSVILELKDSPARRVVMDGQWARPGAIPVSNRSTLQEVIAQASGLTEIGDPTKVFVFRTVDAKRYVANYNVTDIRNGKRPDPRIYGGDTVVSFSSSTRVAWGNLKDILGFGRSVAPVSPVIR